MLAVSMMVLKCVLCQLLFSLLTKPLTEMNLGKLAFICSHIFKMQPIMIVEETGKEWQVTSHMAHTAGKQIQTMQAFSSLTPFLYNSEPQLHMSQSHPHSGCLSPLQLTSSENNLTNNQKCFSIVILNSVKVTLNITQTHQFKTCHCWTPRVSFSSLSEKRSQSTKKTSPYMVTGITLSKSSKSRVSAEFHSNLLTLSPYKISKKTVYFQYTIIQIKHLHPKKGEMQPCQEK